MNRFAFVFVLVASTAALGACGGALAPEDTVDDGGPGTLDAGRDAVGGETSGDDAGVGTGDDGGIDRRDSGRLPDAAPHHFTCPAMLPAKGTSCSSVSLTCEYGGVGDHRLCPTTAVCFDYRPIDGEIAWSVQPPDPQCVGSPSANPPSCPASFDALPFGSKCPAGLATRCVYPEGECACLGCANGLDGGGSSSEWACERWPTPPGCPGVRPHAGDPCGAEGTTCAYGMPCGVTSTLPILACRGGAWVVVPNTVNCPIPRCR